MLGAVTSPITIFILSLFITIIIYILSGKIAPNPSKSKDKISSYACGEDVPAEKVPVVIHLFDYAALFMVFDIVAMILVLSMGFPSENPFKPFLLTLTSIYCFLLFIALFILRRKS